MGKRLDRRPPLLRNRGLRRLAHELVLFGVPGRDLFGIGGRRPRARRRGADDGGDPRPRASSHGQFHPPPRALMRRTLAASCLDRIDTAAPWLLSPAFCPLIPSTYPPTPPPYP